MTSSDRQRRIALGAGVAGVVLALLAGIQGPASLLPGLLAQLALALAVSWWEGTRPLPRDLRALRPALSGLLLLWGLGLLLAFALLAWPLQALRQGGGIGAALGASGLIITGVAQDLHGIVIGFALASLGFGLFRPGFTAGASLSVPRRDQGSIAGMTASINGSVYIVSPAIGVLLYNWHPMVAYGLMAGFCGWLVLWGWSALRLDQPAIS